MRLIRGFWVGRVSDRMARESWTDIVFRRAWPLLFLCVLFSVGVLVISAAVPEKRLAVFSTAANYSVPIEQRQGREYVGLLELLDPLGAVSAKTDAAHWRLTFNHALAEFTAGNSHARVQGRDLDLSAKFLLENGRGLIPLASITSLLPKFLNEPVNLREESNRLFVGNIATHFTASVPADDPSRLIFHFTAPVNPSVASEPGKLRLTFRREPLTGPASPMLTFGSKIIPSADYSENNGAAEIEVSTTIPLIANFSPDGKTITLSPAKSQVVTSLIKSTAPAAPVKSNPQTTTTTATAASTAVTPRRYFAVVDASHGGSDRGEALSPTLAEKDVTVEFARRLRQELESRGIPTLVLRDSDGDVSLDDRAFSVNNSRAAVYIVFHAASNGHGVRLYTALLPYRSDEDLGPFRAWSTGQSSWMALSQATVTSVATELKKLQVPVRTLSAPLRPLNNIVTAAIAIEVAPPANDISALTAPDYQQLIAGAVANGVVAIRGQLEAAP